MAILPAVNIRDRLSSHLARTVARKPLCGGIALAIDSPLKWTKQVASHCIFPGEHIKDASRLEVQQRVFFQQIRILNRPASLFLS
jgi:hypothetical protein